MNHLPFTLAAYLLNSLSVLSNKFLLQKTIPDPIVFVFYISLVSVLAILALPVTHIPAFDVFCLASLSTLSWTLGAYFMFKALKIGNISRVIPIIGTLIPLILLGLASGANAISQLQTWAVGILITGMIFLTATDWQVRLPVCRQARPDRQGKFDKSELLFEVLSAAFFAFSYLVLRQAYLKLDFFSVIVWSRLILLPVGIIILMQPSLRAKIITQKGPRINFLSKEGLIFGAGQASGVISEMLLLFSISLANPALVNSLQGVQYIILLFFSLLLSKKYPAIFPEKHTIRALISKFAGIVLIAIGLYLLAFSTK